MAYIKAGTCMTLRVGAYLTSKEIQGIGKDRIKGLSGWY
jgi:hypothetical protein